MKELLKQILRIFGLGIYSHKIDRLKIRRNFSIGPTGSKAISLLESHKFWLLLLSTIFIVAYVQREGLSSTSASTEQGPIMFSEYSNYFDSEYSVFSKVIKKNLHDPESFEFVSTTYEELGAGDLEIILTYRAKNGFGATRTNRASAILNKNTRKWRNVIFELN